MYNEYIDFILKLQASVKSKPISSTPQNPKFTKFVNFLKSLEHLVDEVPPIQ